MSGNIHHRSCKILPSKWRCLWFIITAFFFPTVIQAAEPAPADSVNILFLGNSFTEDALSAVPHLLKEMLPDKNITVCYSYRGGMLLSQLEKMVIENGNVPIFHTIQNGEHQLSRNVSINQVLASHQWDWIFFQQGSTYSNDPSTYDIIESSLKSKITALLGYTPHWGIHHAKDKTTDADPMGLNRFARQAQACQSLLENGVVETILPSGTALQNLKSVERFMTYGDTGGMERDRGMHLQTGIGMYVESLCFVQWLLDYLSTGLNVEQSEIYPSDKTYYSTNRGQVDGITPQNCSLAKKAARMAINTPAAVTDMNPLDE